LVSVKPHSDATFTTSATLVEYGGSARETVAPVAVTAWKSPSLVAAAVEAAAAAAELISIGEECCGWTEASRTPAPIPLATRAPSAGGAKQWRRRLLLAIVPVTRRRSAIAGPAAAAISQQQRQQEPAGGSQFWASS
jgi:hypothetical protein